MCSGSPVARARMKTTTERIASATSDCRRRKTTKRIIGLLNVAGEPGAYSTSGGSPALPRRPPRVLFPRELVEEQVVHHAARVVLTERLAGRIRRVHVDHRHAVVLAPQPRE